MILFHGSNTDILRIDLSKCKPYIEIQKTDRSILVSHRKSFVLP